MTIHDHIELRASLVHFNKEAMAQSREIDARQEAGMTQSREIEFTTPHSQATNTPEASNTGGRLSINRLMMRSWKFRLEFLQQIPRRILIPGGGHEKTSYDEGEILHMGHRKEIPTAHQA